MDEAKEITFFKTAYRSKRYRSPDRSRRAILVALLKEGKQLSARKLASKSEVPYSTVYEMIPQLVKYGSLRSLSVAKRQHRQDFAYSLTDDGVALAIAIAYENNTLGLGYPSLIQRVFQPNPKDDPMSMLVDYVMLNAVDGGMTEYVLRFMLTAMKQNENSGGGEWKKAGLGAIEVLFEEQKAIKKCILSAFATLTEEDRGVVYQYYKGQLEGMVFRLAQRAHNRELMLIVAESQRDPDNLIMPIACLKCGYKNMREARPMEKVVFEAFTRPYAECPKCGRPIKGNKNTLPLVASLMR